MTDTKRGFEQTFSVSVPVARAWSAFTDPAELEVWFSHRFDADTDDQRAVAQTPGGPVGFAVTEYVECERLGYRQWAASPETGIEVTVVFEAMDGGTRITMTQAGFGSGSVLESDEVRRGMVEALSDLVLYLEHGVRFARHRDITSRSSLGATLCEVPGVVRVVDVVAGELADQTGMQSGDFLLQLGGAAVFDLSDVAFFLREHDEGEETDVVFAHDGEVCRGRGQLAPVGSQLFATAR
jgi:uncharacterized protein YndB with AHSA1/START domain